MDFAELINDKNEINNALKEAVRISAPVELFFKTSKDKSDGHISIEQDSNLKDILAFHLKESELSLKELVENVVSKSKSKVILSIRLSGSYVFFETQYKGFDHQKLLFAIPKSVKKLQRRKNHRVLIPERYPFSTDIVIPIAVPIHLQKKVFDLSAGGISFLVQALEKDSFEVDGKIQLRFTVKDGLISTDAVVKHIFQMDDQKTYRVACEFRGLKPEDESLLSKFVFELQRTIFAKFI